MPKLTNLKSFIKSKRLAIKSFYFSSLLLLVFISAIIMITNDYPQDTSCNNAITTSSTNSFSSQKTSTSEDKCQSSEHTETLKVSVFIYSFKS